MQGKYPSNILWPTSVPVLKEPDPNCNFCRDGSDPVWLRCHQCGLIFHVHAQTVAHVPIGYNVMVPCPDPVCAAQNVFTRVPIPDCLVNPDDFESAAVLGESGPELRRVQHDPQDERLWGPL